MTYDENFYGNIIAGVDEAGRGALAGPVVAAAVILPGEIIIGGLNDSKKLSPKRREELFGEIIGKAEAIRLSVIGSEEVDEINILNASLKAMREAVKKLPVSPEIALIDGIHSPDIDIKTLCVKGGDGKSASIAAASIAAKVARDRIMAAYAKTYPGYGFERHKGYGTPAHYAAIKALGPCPIHRRSFRLH